MAHFLPLAQQPIARLLPQDVIVPLVGDSGVYGPPYVSESRRFEEAVSAAGFSAFLDGVSASPRHEGLGARHNGVYLGDYGGLLIQGVIKREI